jgi:hypothetical protein
MISNLHVSEAGRRQLAVKRWTFSNIRGNDGWLSIANCISQSNTPNREKLSAPAGAVGLCPEMAVIGRDACVG